jgi:hypothetical protein
MRFSRHRNTPPSDPAEERGRRRAKFLNCLKAEIREAAHAQGLNLSDLAREMGCHKSVVTRALNPDSNIEALTLFDFAEVLGKEWAVRLCDKHQDLAHAFDDPAMHKHFKTSWSPVVGGCASDAKSTSLNQLVEKPRRTSYKTLAFSLT